MKKRVALLIILIIASFMALSAISVEELYQQVLQNSPMIADLSTTRYYSFVDTVLTSLNGPNITIGVQGAEFSFNNNLTEYYYQLPGLEITYTSPESDKKITYDARASLGSIKFDGENDFKPGTFEITFHGGVSKVYEFKSWDDTDYSKGWSDTLNRIMYENTILQYENEFLSDIRDLLLIERETIEPFMVIGSYILKYYTGLNNGEFTEDSPEGIKLYTEMMIQSKATEQITDSYRDKLQALADKYNVTIEDLMLIESAEKYELALTPMEEGNYEVHSKYLDMLAIQQQINEKLGTSSSLTLRAGVDPKISFIDNLKQETNGISGEVGASYTTGKLTLDLSVTSGYNYNLESMEKTLSGPTITLGGTWSNTPQVLSNDEIARLKALYTTGTTFNRDAYESVLRDLSNNALKKEILEIEKLEASLNAAISDWNNALGSYNNRCNELIQEIKNLKNEFELFMIKYEGDIKLDERMKELYDEGKVSEDDYLEAEAARSISDTDLIIYNIRSHILYNEIQMLQK